VCHGFSLASEMIIFEILLTTLEESLIFGGKTLFVSGQTILTGL
jgi:hypothetical protein